MTLTTKQQEAIDYRGSLCLSAGAGTGKTTTLVQKYLDLLDRPCSSKNILALTYTDKAAAEMRDRVRKGIADRSDGRAEELLEDFHWSTILTFHSFCAQIIRDFPLETGVDPSFTVLDDAQINIILEEAGNRVFASSDPQVIDALSKAMVAIEVKRMPKLFASLYKNRNTTTPFFDSIGTNMSDILDEAGEELVKDACLTFSTDRKVLKVLNRLRELATLHPDDKFLSDAKPDLEMLCGEPSPEEAYRSVLRLMGCVPSGNYGSSKVFGEDLKNFKENLNGLKDLLKKKHKIAEFMDGDDPLVREKIAEFLMALKTLDHAFQREVNRLKRERNGIDFGDMISAIHSLFLRDQSFVRKYFTSRYRYILVDETQDTDRMQLDIIQAIIGEGEGASDRLFVVGDPKQSIFFFRGVDVSLFKDTRNYVIEELKGRYIPLDVNHRSTEQVVGLVNAVFRRLMDREVRPWEFAYEPVVPSEMRQGHKGSVQMHYILGVEPRSNQRYIAEGNEIVSIIRNAVDGGKIIYEEQKDKTFLERGTRYKDIAILLRTRTSMFFYERALKLAGIPYRVHRGQGFFARQEVLDMYNLLRFLSDQSDNVALFGILRSPYFGLSDSEIHSMAAGRRGMWYSRLREASETNSRLTSVRDRLDRWVDYARWEAVGDLVNRLVVESNIMTVYGGLEGGSEMAANLNKLKDRLVALQSSGFATIREAVESLANSITEEQRDGEAQVEDGSDRVTLMTVHAAKGLEWPIVILPDIDRQLNDIDDDLIKVDRQLGLGIKVVSPVDLDLTPDPVMRRIKLQWGLKTKAEFQRLLYVAMTRARDHLYLVGVTDWIEADKDPIEDANSWFQLLAGALKITGDKLASGQVPYIDTPERRGVLLTVPVKMDLGGSWKEGEEHSVPDWLRALPIDAPPIVPSIPKKRNLSPSKRRASVEDDAWDFEEEEEIFVDNEENKSFGIMVHEVFQGQSAQTVLLKYGKDDEELARKMDEMYARFQACELMREMVYERTELPYIGRKGEKGIIDRLVKKVDGSWILIDYKTGAPREEDIEDKKAFYRGQIDAYVEAAAEIIGQTPKAYLYFTHNGRMVEM